jgi:hypothetical protein
MWIRLTPPKALKTQKKPNFTHFCRQGKKEKGKKENKELKKGKKGKGKKGKGKKADKSV